MERHTTIVQRKAQEGMIVVIVVALTEIVMGIVVVVAVVTIVMVVMGVNLDEAVAVEIECRAIDALETRKTKRKILFLLMIKMSNRLVLVKEV